MKLFDTHAHLNFPDYEMDYREVWARAQQAGLVGLINVGTDLATSKRAVEIAQELGLTPGRAGGQGVFAAVGIHPTDAKQYVGEESWKRSIEELIQDKAVVAVGETGLDFYRVEQGERDLFVQTQLGGTAADLTRSLTEIDTQMDLLEYCLDLADKYDKPLLFHCRPSQGSHDAYETLLGVLKEWKGSNGLRGVIHAFGGDAEIAKQFLDLGLHISFTAQVTYPKNEPIYADLLPKIPLDRLLLETDCPFLPPEGLRGQRNEPRHVDIVASIIAKFLGRKTEEIAEKTTENAYKLFGVTL